MAPYPAIAAYGVRRNIRKTIVQNLGPEHRPAILLVTICRRRFWMYFVAKVFGKGLEGLSIHLQRLDYSKLYRYIYHSLAPISLLACSLNSLFKIFPLAVFGI